MSGHGDWQRVRTLFAEALELPEAERDGWIAAQCGDDAETLAELRSLLAAQSAPRSGFLSRGEHMFSPLFAAQSQAPTAPGPGSRIGPYQLLREIGAGGMGRVFLAERADGQVNRQVALKLIRGEFSHPELQRRFLRERDTLARLAHPNVATLHDGGVADDGAPYFTMELVEGEPIDQWCDARHRDVRARVGLVLKICDAVQYAHRNLVVHRDIKPSNILVTASGEPKLLDFGIAKPLAADAASGEQTGTNVQPMTREYAAPEQVLGEPVTIATDEYSLGVLLYELLSGHRPYRRASLGEIGWSKAIVEEPPEPLDRAVERAARGKEVSDAPRLAAARGTSVEALKRLLRGDLERIVQRALAKAPEARYSTVGAMADDLRAYLDGRALSGGTRRYRLRKFVRRHWLPLAAGAAAVLATIGGAAGIAWEARQREHAAESALREAKTSASVKDFLIGLFEAVDPQQAKGRNITARELLDRGKKNIDAKPPDDAIVKAEMQAVLGRIDFRLGLFTEASELQRQAATAFGTDGTHPLQLLQAELDRSETLVEALDFKTATTTLAAADAHLRALPDAPARERTRLLTLQSRLAVQQRKFADAKRSADAAVALARSAHVDDRLLTHALLVAGDAEWGLHALDAAEAHFREGLALAERTEGTDGMTVASMHRNLGIVAASRSHYADALAEVQIALDIHSKVLGPEHPLTLDDMTEIAQYQQHLGHFREASELLKKTDAIQQRTLGAESPARGGTLVNLGVALIGDDDLPGAEHAFEAAIAIWQPKFGRDFQGVQFAVGNLGHVHRRQGRLDEAEAELAEVQRGFEAHGVKDDPELFYQLGELQRLRGHADAAVKLDRQGLDAAQAKEGESSETTALAHRYLALALRDSGDKAGAQRELRASLAFFDGAFAQTGHPYEATAQLELATMLAGDSGGHDEALRLAGAAADIRTRFFGVDDARTRAAREIALHLDTPAPTAAAHASRAKHAEHRPRAT
jgi:serine/threonine-protein kinase